MAKLHVRLGDNVLVMAGKDNGKSGKIIAADPSNGKVIVEGINVVSKNKKPKNAQDKGGIIKKEAGIDASNVMIICPVCKKATRVANDISGETKFRKCKKCNANLDTNKAMKKASKKAESKVEDITKSAPKKDVKKETKVAVAPKAAAAKKPTATKSTVTNTRKVTTAKTAVRKTGDKV